MKLTKVIDAYRRCGRCGRTSNDLTKSECECGGYMAVISSMYVPVAGKKVKR